MTQQENIESLHHFYFFGNENVKCKNVKASSASAAVTVFIFFPQLVFYNFLQLSMGMVEDV